MSATVDMGIERAGRGHAIVVGGSMAGLMATRVLADHFERVTLIERDRFPDEPAFRAGVPQSRHLHVLLARGMDRLEALFPGLRSELIGAGAQPVQWPRDALWLTAAGWSQRFHHQGIEIVSSTRHLLEWSVRRRVLALPNVNLLPERTVTDLRSTADRSRVIGVRHQPRHRGEAADAEAADLPADLVVDASGRNSRAPHWLESLGYPAPKETVITAFLGYASRFFAPPADLQADWKVLYLQANPPANARMGGLFPMEGNRWIVSLGGAGRDYPPTDEAGFLEFARSLRSPVLYEAIRAAEPLSPIHGYQRTENQLRHYEQLTRFPEQFLVIGDAVCAFNPVYGQGMSVASQEAAALDACLRDQRRRQPNGSLDGLSRRFQRQIAKTAADAWLIATGEDLRYPETEGASPGTVTKLMHRYLNRVIATATGHVGVNRAFVEVLNLQASPNSLFRLQVLLPTLRGGGRGSAPTPTGDPPPVPLAPDVQPVRT